MCANALAIRRDRIEQELISGLQREVLREDVAAFALEEFKRQLRARLADTRSHLPGSVASILEQAQGSGSTRS